MEVVPISTPSRLDLALTPTPLQYLSRLSAEIGHEIWMKRDDLSGDFGLSGNKVRKLEYLMADAVAQGATHVLTTGGPQSNHARATAAAAAKLGLKPLLYLAGRDPGGRSGNLLLDQLFGAEIRFLGHVGPQEQQQALEDAAAKLAAAGCKPYVIPVGGSTPLGSIGSFHCYEEIAAAAPRDAWLCCATGSGGTQAGLALGAALLGKAVRVQGFSVWQPADTLQPVVERLAREAGALLGRQVDAVEAHVDDAYLGPAYGRASQAGLEAIRLVARLEAILLDPVYTGKAMAGVLDYVRKGLIPPEVPIIFVHTGGAQALFAS